MIFLHSYKIIKNLNCYLPVLNLHNLCLCSYSSRLGVFINISYWTKMFLLFFLCRISLFNDKFNCFHTFGSLWLYAVISKMAVWEVPKARVVSWVKTHKIVSTEPRSTVLFDYLFRNCPLDVMNTINKLTVSSNTWYMSIHSFYW